MKKFFLFSFMLASLFSFLYAQEEESVYYLQEKKLEGSESESDTSSSEDNLESGLQESGEFIQVLRWNTQGNVLKYVVIVEKKSKGTFEEILREETDKTELVVSLEPGQYRFKVDYYNALRRVAFSTNWENFEILIAYELIVKDVSPKVIYLEEYNDGVFTIDGKNFKPGAEFSMNGALSGKVLHKPLSVETNDRETKSTLQFDIDKIDVGNYTVSVKNPGGLSSQSEPIRIQFKKPMDLDVSAGIAPPYILFDDTFGTYMESNLYAKGLGAKICFIPFKRRWGYLGVGLIGSATLMDAEFDNYSIDGYMFTGHLNFIYQKIFANRHLIFEAFAGGGLLMFKEFYFHFPNNIESAVLDSTNFSADAGLALDIYITKRIFIDITAQFVFGFISDMAFGMVVPRVSLGYQF